MRYLVPDERDPAGDGDGDQQTNHRSAPIPSFGHGAAHHFSVVERQDLVADGLGLLVALAGHDDHVGGAVCGDGDADRLGPVGDHVEVGSLVETGDDRRDDLVGVFAARIVRRHDDPICACGGSGAHERALVPVAITAATEHDGDPGLRGELADGGEDLGETVGGVGVVHDDRRTVRCGVGAGDDLEPARDLSGCRQPGGDRRVGDVGEACGLGGGERVVHVEASGNGQAHLVAPPSEHRTLDGARQVLGVGVGDDRQLERGTTAELVDQAATPLVVAVDDGGRHHARAKHRCLGREVVLHRVVVVEMVWAEVGEHPDVEAGAEDPVLHERMRRDLHRHRLETGLDHHAQSSLEVRGFRCGAFAGQGADLATGDTGVIEDRRGEMRRGRLAVRARHADGEEFSGRVPLECAGHHGHGGTSRSHDDLRHRQRRRGVGRAEPPLDEQRRGSCVDGGRGVVVAVGSFPGERHEEIAGADGARVEADRGDLGVVVARVGSGRGHGRPSEFGRPTCCEGDQTAESHGPASGSTGPDADSSNTRSVSGETWK